MLKDGSQCIGLLVILLDSVISRITDYYPELSLEECK